MAHSSDAHAHDANVYYVPHGSRWPVVASVALFVTMVGFSGWLNEASWGRVAFFLGLGAYIGVGTLLKHPSGEGEEAEPAALPQQSLSRADLLAVLFPAGPRMNVEPLIDTRSWFWPTATLPHRSAENLPIWNWVCRPT